MYEKVLYAALYEYISGLYFEHRFINALLIELSSLFYTLKSEKEIIASYPSMKTSILLSIEKINSSLEEMLISCNECHERPNTELLRLFSAGRSERKFGKCKDLNKEKEREIIKALKCRKAELELDRCQRSHTSLVREEIKDLNNRLFSIGREHRRRYFSSLFYYLRKYDYKNFISTDQYPYREDSRDAVEQTVKWMQAFEKAAQRIDMDRMQKILDANDAVASTAYMRELLFG